MDETKRLIAETVDSIKAAYEHCKKQEHNELADRLMTARENLQAVREQIEHQQAEQSALRDKIKSIENSLKLQPLLVRQSFAQKLADRVFRLGAMKK